MTTPEVLPTSRDGSSPTPSRPNIFVGIDVGYREHVAVACPLTVFITPGKPDAWRRLRTVHFSSDAAGYKSLQRYFDKFSLSPRDFLILLEPTGGYYGLTLQMYLLGRGYQVVQVENRAVKDYREKVFGSETKTDDTDARLMARMAFLHEMVGEEFSIQPVRLTNPDEAALRVMVRDLHKLQQEILRRTNQLQQIVAVSFPEFKTFFIDSTAGKAARTVLARFPTPRALADASPEEVVEALKSARAFRHAKRAAELIALAQTTAGVTTLSHHQWRQAWILKQLPTLEEARKELLGQLEGILASHPYVPIIESLPLKSPIWTATLIAVIGPMDRYHTYADFRAYCGWFPGVEKSGSSVNNSRLAKKGVRLARRVIGQMATVLLFPTVRDTPFREYYNKLIARGMPPMTARGHLAGKLASVLYSMLKTNKPYDERRHRRDLGMPEVPEEETRPVDVPDDVVETVADVEDASEESPREDLSPD